MLTISLLQASIASGSTTTRLLGTFQGVEYVLIVGVGGGVPHYTDYNRSGINIESNPETDDDNIRHVRLGDVVLSSPNSSQAGQRFIYQYCQTAR